MASLADCESAALFSRFGTSATIRRSTGVLWASAVILCACVDGVRRSNAPQRQSDRAHSSASHLVLCYATVNAVTAMLHLLHASRAPHAMTTSPGASSILRLCVGVLLSLFSRPPSTC